MHVGPLYTAIRSGIMHNDAEGPQDSVSRLRVAFTEAILLPMAVSAAR
jgi:hypothetical protein